MSLNNVGVASTSHTGVPSAAISNTTRVATLNRSTRTRQVDFVTKIEDGVYIAAGVVKEEAKTIDGIAEKVEKVSALIEGDADKVQTFVHQLHVTAESMESDVNKAAMNLLSGPSRTQVAPKSGVADDFLKFGWGWNVFRIFLVVLIFVIVLLHNKGNVNLKLIESETTHQQSGGSSKTPTLPTLSMLLINIGPIMKVLSFVKSIITREEKILGKVEEDVDEAAQHVKKTVRTVAEIAEAVEKVSQRLEQDSENVQTFIRQTKVTATMK